MRGGPSYDRSRAAGRSYFALQATFAARVVDIYGTSFAEAWRLHTAFYALARDNDAGVAPERNNFDADHPDWVAFLEAVDDGMDPVDYVYKAYLDGDAQEDTGATCFDFTYWPEDRLVRIHLSNDRNGAALRPSTADDRRRELKRIFQTVARDHPDACAVRGTSWLYHLDAYRRLFPPSFIAGLSSVGHPRQFARCGRSSSIAMVSSSRQWPPPSSKPSSWLVLPPNSTRRFPSTCSPPVVRSTSSTTTSLWISRRSGARPLGASERGS